MNYSMFDSEIEKSYSACPYKRLWASVLIQAIKDIDTREGGAQAIKTRYEAKRWFFQKGNEEFSPSWICDILDLDINRLLNKCCTQEGRENLLSSQKEKKKMEQEKKQKKVKSL
jgi:hypothetical protein